MAPAETRPSIPVPDRIILHLWEQDHQADHYIVSPEVTRLGIAESCALHPPNVSRAVRKLTSKGLISQHSRTVRGENRRQKTWQLTEEGREDARERASKLRTQMVLVRSKDGELLEIRADEAANKLRAGLSLLQILMHAQHEGILNFGDIRFGALVSGSENKPPPGSISIFSGAHSTYDTSPPMTRTVHGRKEEKRTLDIWLKSKKSMLVLTGIAGCGKTTLASHWINQNSAFDVMYYPCQPWDSPLGIATSLLHRIGISEKSKDPYNILETLPYMPAARLELDSFRRRLTAHLLDEEALLDSKSGNQENREMIVILDDVHNIGTRGDNLFGALLQAAEASKFRLLLISRTNLGFYDRRDVHTRGRVEELSLSGLSLDEVSSWLESIDLPEQTLPEDIHRATGGHPLAVELLEMYGKTLHEDWTRFLDEEILNVLPPEDKEALSILAVSDRPVPWRVLARASGIDGSPPTQLVERGLMLELDEGMWLHEALRSRLLREVGAPLEERLRKLEEART
ncbi:MAG: hypothetical protein CMB67_01600 [Euryarchaeota archaeon]|nr:hypothetical protein [Euryarchaeota archaeon]